MSKHKKKKNHRRVPQKPIIPKKKPIPWLTIILSITVVLMAAAIALVIWKPWQVKNDEPEIRATERYLEEKYKLNFDYCTTVSGNLDLYQTAGVDGLIAVGNTQAFINNLEYDKKLYDPNYADNGYPILKEKEIAEYYAQFLGSDCGTYRILTYLSASAFPDDMDMDMSAEEAIKKYPDYMVPMLFVLTDKKLNSDQLTKITNSFKDSGLQVMLRMAYATPEAQQAVSIDQLMHSWMQNYNVLLSLNINIDLDDE